MSNINLFFELCRRTNVLKQLQNRGLIVRVDDTPEGIILTEKGRDLLNVEVTESSQVGQNIHGVRGWIDEYRDCFGKEFTGRAGLRGDVDACVVKMEKFMAKTGYTKDIILAATKSYIRDKVATNGRNFIRRADYFISKMDVANREEVSDLSVWCESTNLPHHEVDDSM
jgi:hypothetical protein